MGMAEPLLDLMAAIFGHREKGGGEPLQWSLT